MLFIHENKNINFLVFPMATTTAQMSDRLTCLDELQALLQVFQNAISEQSRGQERIQKNIIEMEQNMTKKNSEIQGLKETVDLLENEILDLKSIIKK